MLINKNRPAKYWSANRNFLCSPIHLEEMCKKSEKRLHS
nr:MAG TPA: hypothetical protein [Caudoviricetes sp.]